MSVHIPRRFRHTLLGLVNRPYLSAALAGARRPLIVHISDTPRMSYPFVLRIARQLRPEYLIHTGDVVDDIKLENRPQEIRAYSREVAGFLSRLEATPVGAIYLVPGNHDAPGVLEDNSSRAVTVPEGAKLHIAGLSVSVSHHYDVNIGDGDFYLYGHTPSPAHHRRGRTECLNGIAGVTVIEVPSRTLHILPYPAGTDDVRKLLLPKPGL
ncbi:MAG: metallophosphoesterase [Spirochaetaceae bacterium]